MLRGMDTSILAYIATGVAGLGLSAWRLSDPPSTFGSAGWLRPWVASGNRMFRGDGLLVGDWAGLLPVYYQGSGHALTVAPTGSGKGVAAILPNLLRYPWIFLVDPGGENTAVAAKAWRDKGYEFYCLNPWGMHAAAPWSLPAHAVNPLDVLDPASQTFVSDAGLLAEMIVTRSGREDGSTSFFKDEAQSGLRAFIMHIATTEEPARRNLLTLRKYVTSRADAWESLLAAMEANQVAGGIVAREAVQMGRREAQAPEEFSAVLSTMKQDTNFIEDPVLQRALAASTTDLTAIKGTAAGRSLAGCAVSVVIPLQYLETHAAYARLIIGVMLLTMQRPPLARGRVLFLLDEFPALKRVDRIADGLATLRKYRVLLHPIIQNIGQLKQLYAKNWQTFLSNAGMKQFIGAGDIETAQYVSDLCGEGTITTFSKGPNGKTKSQTKRRLATAQEIIQMDKRLQIVFFDNLKPMLLRRTAYWLRPSLRGTFERNPFQAQTPNLDWRTPLWLLQGAAVRLCAWLVRPSPVVVAAALYWCAGAMDTGLPLGLTTYGAEKRPVCSYLTAKGVALRWPDGSTAKPECPFFF
jgi:type IV secretion system protein VirD4